MADGEAQGGFAPMSIAEATVSGNLNSETQKTGVATTDVKPEPATKKQEKMDDDGDDDDDDSGDEANEDELLGDSGEKMEAEMEEKLKIDGDHDDEEHEEHKDEGPKIGKTFEKINELKEAVNEKLNEILPAAFKTVRKLTVNIGPIKLADLKSPGLHTILSLTSHFEMTYDKQKSEDGIGSERIRRFSTLEYDGYVKMRFEVTTPQFFVLVYNKLTNLTINGRNMSVKLPEQFEQTLKEAKEYRKKREEIFRDLRQETLKLRLDEKKRSVYLRNLPKTADLDKLKSLFTNVEDIIGPMKLGGGEAIGATLIFPTREEAIQCVQSNGELEMDEKKVKVTLTISEKQELAMEAQAQEQQDGVKKKKNKKKKKKGGEGAMQMEMGGGGGSGRKRRRGNRGGYDEGYDMPFPYPQGDSDPVSMISMLRSTLARMEENLGGYSGGRGYMDGGRGGMGYGGGRMYDDDYGGGRFMGGQGFGNRPSLLGEGPGFQGFGGGMMGGFQGGFGQFGGSYSSGGGRNRKRKNKKSSDFI